MLISLKMNFYSFGFSVPKSSKYDFISGGYRIFFAS